MMNPKDSAFLRALDMVREDLTIYRDEISKRQIEAVEQNNTALFTEQQCKLYAALEISFILVERKSQYLDEIIKDQN